MLDPCENWVTTSGPKHTALEWCDKIRYDKTSFHVCILSLGILDLSKVSVLGMCIIVYLSLVLVYNHNTNIQTNKITLNSSIQNYKSLYTF